MTVIGDYKKYVVKSIYADGDGIGYLALSELNTDSYLDKLEIFNDDKDSVLTLSCLHATDYDPYIRFRSNDPLETMWSIGSDSGDSDKFKIYNGDGIGETSEFVFDTSGRFGIGTASPDGTLHVMTDSADDVKAHDNADDLVVENNVSGGISILTLDYSTGGLFFGSAVSNHMASIRYDHNNSILRFRTADVDDRMVIDADGNVGINIYAPEGTLHVHTETAGSVIAHANADDLIIENDVSAGISILTLDYSVGAILFGSDTSNERASVEYNHNTELFSIRTYDVDNRLVIDSDGFVGINTDSPDGLLHIYTESASVTANANADDLIIENNTHAGISILTLDYSIGSIYFGSATSNHRAGIGYNHNTELFSIRTYDVDNRLVIDSDGFVGINTDSPDGSLHVFTASADDVKANTDADDLTVENDTHGGISILTLDYSIGSIYFGSATSNQRASIEYDHNNDSLHIRTVDVDNRLVIDSNGNVGIGIFPTYQFHMQTSGDTSQNIFMVENSSTNDRIEMTLDAGGDADFSLWDGSDNKDVFITAGGVSYFKGGPVGIGRNDPFGLLHVYTASSDATAADVNADDLIVENDTHGGISILTLDYSIGSLYFGSALYPDRAAIEYNHNTEVFSIRANSTDDRLVIDSNGYVGIGVSNPSAFYEPRLVVGEGSGHESITIYSGASSYGFLLFADAASADGYFEGQISYNHNTDQMAFATEHTNRMFIDNTGKVAIGMEPAGWRFGIKSAGTTSQNLFEIQDSSGNPRIQMSLDSGGDADFQLYDGSNNSDVVISAGGISYLKGGPVVIGGTAVDGLVHIMDSDASATAHDNANELVIEAETYAGLSILTDATSFTSIYFGDNIDNDNGGIIYNHNASEMGFRVAGTSNRLVIDSDGFVGIGQTAPQYQCEIYGSNHNLRIDSSDANKCQIDIALQGTAKCYWGTQAAMTGGGTNHNTGLYHQGTESLVLGHNASAQVYLEDTGELGIGVSNPSAFYESRLVAGAGSGHESITIYSGAFSYGFLLFADATSSTGYYEGQISYNHNGDTMAFATNHANRAYIDINGNFGIGKPVPTYLLHLQTSGNTSQNVFEVENLSGDNRIQMSFDAGGDADFSLYDASNNKDVFLTAGGDSYLNGGNVAIADYTKLGGGENIKVYSYSHGLSATEVIAGSFLYTLSPSITLTKIRSIVCVGYDVSTTNVYSTTDQSSNEHTRAAILSASQISIFFGSTYVENDIISFTIIEAE